MESGVLAAVQALLVARKDVTVRKNATGSSPWERGAYWLMKCGSEEERQQRMQTIELLEASGGRNLRFKDLASVVAANPAVQKAWRNAHPSVTEFLMQRFERDPVLSDAGTVSSSEATESVCNATDLRLAAIQSNQFVWVFRFFGFSLEQPNSILGTQTFWRTSQT